MNITHIDKNKQCVHWVITITSNSQQYAGRTQKIITMLTHITSRELLIAKHFHNLNFQVPITCTILNKSWQARQISILSDYKNSQHVGASFSPIEHTCFEYTCISQQNLKYKKRVFLLGHINPIQLYNQKKHRFAKHNTSINRVHYHN